MMVEGGVYDIDDLPVINKVPIEDILRQHRKRYIIRTEKHGDVVLKYMTRTARIPVDTFRYSMYPSLFEWEAEFREVAPIAELPSADEETKKRAAELVSLIIPTLDWYLLVCIEYPMLNTIYELSAFLDCLSPEEHEAVRQMLTVLTSHVDKVDTGYMELAERFGVSVVDKELLDSMTMQQEEVLMGILNAERTKERNIYKKMGVDI